MMRSTLLLLCAAACLAQTPKTPPQPPADVDAALRARVYEFFQYHVTGQFRKAEALVAEDTKDLFYNRNKPRYIKFVEIARIDYSENFTKATATVMVVSPEMIPGWSEGPPTIPIPSTWKIENGQWCWYLEPDVFLRTPFGSFPVATMKAAAASAPGMLPSSVVPGNDPNIHTVAPPAPKSGNAAAPAALPTPGSMFPVGVAPTTPMPSAPDPAALAAIAGANKLGMSAAGIPGMVPAEALGLVKLDKTAVTLTGDTADSIHFSNTAPDGRTIMILGAVAGIDAKIDRAELPAGETATLTFKAGKDAKDGVLNLVIPQTGEMYSIKITVKK